MARKGFATRQKSVEAFIEEANETPGDRSGEPEIAVQDTTDQDGHALSHPWENPELSSRVQKQYNLRLDEVTLEKLRWVGKNVTVSTHQWVVDVLKAAIDEKIRELT